MNVLFLSNVDWANMGYNFSMALKSVGVDSTAAYSKDNPIGNLGVKRNRGNLEELLDEADTVILNHTDLSMTVSDIKKLIINRGKKLLVLHGGSKYRQNYKKYNNIYNPIVDVTLNFYDLGNRGAVNEKLLVVPIDTNFLQPDYETPDKLVIAHYPIDINRKGTRDIFEAIEKVRGNFVFECNWDGANDERGKLPILKWGEYLNKLRKCDIYIENLHNAQNDVPLTSFGVTTIEVAALGGIPVTLFKHMEEYEHDFGKCAVQVANTINEVHEKIEWLLSLSKGEILKLKRQARDWVVRCHSYEAVGLRLKYIIEDIDLGNETCH